jgi:hypothetical protein
MNNSNSTRVDVAAAAWPDFMGNYTPVLQSNHRDLVLAPGRLSTSGSELRVFDVPNNAAFSQALTTSMGNVTAKLNYPLVYPPTVSKQLFDHRHWLTLLRAQNATDARSKAFLDARSVAPQLISDPQWTGVSRPAIYSMTAASNVSANATVKSALYSPSPRCL